MDSGFKVPQIPTIFVKDFPVSGEQRRRKISTAKTATVKPEAKTDPKPQPTPVAVVTSKEEAISKETKTQNTIRDDFKFCHSCSLKVLSCFKPLQKYVNEIVSIAEETVGKNCGDPLCTPVQAETLLRSLTVGSESSELKPIEQHSNGGVSADNSTASTSKEITGLDGSQGSQTVYGNSNNALTTNYNLVSNTFQDPAGREPLSKDEFKQGSSQLHVQSFHSSQESRPTSGEDIQRQTQNETFNKENQTRETKAAHVNQVPSQHSTTSTGPHHAAQGANGSSFQIVGQNSNQVPSSSNTPHASPEQVASQDIQSGKTSSGQNFTNEPSRNENTGHEQSRNEYAGGDGEPLSIPPNQEKQMEQNNESSIAVSERKSHNINIEPTTPSDYPFQIVQNEPLYSNLDESAQLCTPPYALVTIACSNLAATNAIALANSFHLTNNNVIYINEEKTKKALIPFIVVVGGTIDPLLKSSLYTIFDEVVTETEDLRLSLLNNKMLGLQLYKLQLWKVMSKYSKCLFIESSCVVVGTILNLFFECKELSAAVDWLFPDYFSCSVFLFQPSNDTYNDLVQFAMSLQLSSNQHHLSNDAVDEMTVLNQYFAGKWNKLSFIYNYVQHDAVYSQQPAFMKYGSGIKIVNFGYSGVGLTPQSGHNPNVVSQPWHIQFDLLASNQSGEVITAAQVNNFVKYYLTIFMKRLWPLIQRHMTSLIMKQNFGRRDWTVFDLIQLFSSKSGLETDDHMFTQHQMTLRRKISLEERVDRLGSSDAEKTPEKERISVEETQDAKDKDHSPVSVEANEEKTTDIVEEDAEAGATSTTRGTTEEQEKEVEDPDRQKKAWESGRIDWMGEHRSDNIINRIKGKIG